MAPPPPPHGEKSAEVKEESAAVDNRPISTIVFIIGTFFKKKNLVFTLFVCSICISASSNV